jgi:ketosteroid isomerase-like protein
MSTEVNKAVVRRLFEAYDKHSLAGVEELFAPDYVWHGPATYPDMDLAAMKQAMTPFFTAFPDLNYMLEDLIAEGDKVVWRFTARATHGHGVIHHDYHDDHGAGRPGHRDGVRVGAGAHDDALGRGERGAGHGRDLGALRGRGHDVRLRRHGARAARHDADRGRDHRQVCACLSRLRRPGQTG